MNQINQRSKTDKTSIFPWKCSSAGAGIRPETGFFHSSDPACPWGARAFRRCASSFFFFPLAHRLCTQLRILFIYSLVNALLCILRRNACSFFPLFTVFWVCFCKFLFLTCKSEGKLCHYTCGIPLPGRNPLGGRENGQKRLPYQ